MPVKRVLHVGCGMAPLPPIWDNVEEVRMDIDPDCNPDIVASLTDMGDIGEFDAIYGSHVLEHFYPHDVNKVLSECHRVLKSGGQCVMIVPNMEDIRPTRDTVYMLDSGPITGLDMFYGKESLLEGNPYMAHKTAFVPETLKSAFSCFRLAETKSLAGYNLMGVGVK